MLDFRILGAAMALDEFTAADVAARSGCSIDAVRKVIQRKGDLFESVRRQATGQAGHPPFVYRLSATGRERAREEAQALLDAVPLPEVPTAKGLPLGLATAEKMLLDVFPRAGWDECRDVLEVADANFGLAEKQIGAGERTAGGERRPGSSVHAALLTALRTLRGDLGEIVRLVSRLEGLAGLELVHEAAVDRLRTGLAPLLFRPQAPQEPVAERAHAAVRAARELGEEAWLISSLQRLLSNQLWADRAIGAADVEAVSAVIEETSNPRARLTRLGKFFNALRGELEERLGRVLDPAAPGQLLPAGVSLTGLAGAWRMRMPSVRSQPEFSVVLAAGDSSIGSAASSLSGLAAFGKHNHIPMVLVDASFDGALSSYALREPDVAYYGNAAALAEEAAGGLAQSVSSEIQSFGEARSPDGQ